MEQPNPGFPGTNPTQGARSSEPLAIGIVEKFILHLDFKEDQTGSILEHDWQHLLRLLDDYLGRQKFLNNSPPYDKYDLVIPCTRLNRALALQSSDSRCKLVAEWAEAIRRGRLWT